MIDLRHAFETEDGAQPLQLHFEENPHWNARGHALAARVMADHLKAFAKKDARSPFSERDIPRVAPR